MLGESKTKIDQDFALVVQQGGKSETTLAKFLKLLLSYKHELPAEIVKDFRAIPSILRRSSQHLRCACVIQSQVVNTRSTIPVLGDKGRLPLFLVLPGHVAQQQREAGGEQDNVFVCQWELAFTSGKGSLQHAITEGLAGQVTESFKFKEGEEFEERLKHLDTLPTVPDLVMHIMRVLSDPKTTMAQLEELLSSDPAVVLKVMQVANSALFAGSAHKGQWTLKEAIVRLGLRKVGTIAQQISLMNCFVVPEDSDFDMQRFWEHSVGCALVADRLVEDRLVTLQDKVEFNDYWLGCLLHDVGMLVQGFFFWEWFERIVRSTDDGSISYHEAEKEMGGLVTHEFIGELLMRKSQMSKDLVEAVRLHHVTGDSPGSLVSLVHVANSLVKELGLGYFDKEPTDYSRPALDALKLTRQGVRVAKDALEESVVGQVKQLVKQCMS